MTTRRDTVVELTKQERSRITVRAIIIAGVITIAGFSVISQQEILNTQQANRNILQEVQKAETLGVAAETRLVRNQESILSELRILCKAIPGCSIPPIFGSSP